MKKHFLIEFSFLVLILFCTCTSTNVTKNTIPHIYTNNESTEIEILGEVFFESKDRIGYIEILKTARNLYPECHFVIDIMIDQIVTTTNETKNLLFRSTQSSKTDIVWVMRGTAVKYKNIEAFASLGSAAPPNTNSSVQSNVNTSTSVNENRSPSNPGAKYTVRSVGGRVEQEIGGNYIRVIVGDGLNDDTMMRFFTDGSLIISDGNTTITIPRGTNGILADIINRFGRN